MPGCCPHGLSANRAHPGTARHFSVTLGPANESHGVCVPKDVGMERVFFCEVVRRLTWRKSEHLYDLLAIRWI